jgi:L-lactate dehydrogenase complex protein LldG
MTTRADFIERVRSTLGRNTGAPSPVGTLPYVDESLLRLASPQAGLSNLFAARAGAAGMDVHRCTLATLSERIQQLLDSLGARRIVLDHLADGLDSRIAETLTGRHVINPAEAKSLDPHFDAEVGVTGVLAAIAETGTLAVASGASRSRGTFIIPPVHVALVREAEIIPDMLDLWPRINRPPTALTLITGPSKTADIEGILVTGVHGPRAVHVFIIEPVS